MPTSRDLRIWALSMLAAASLSASSHAQNAAGVVDYGDDVPTLDELRGALGADAQMKVIEFDDPRDAGVQGGPAQVDQKSDKEPPLAASASQTVSAPKPSGVVSMRIGFRHNSADVDPEFLPNIAAIAGYLDAEPRSRLLIIGHADASGDAGYNKELSRRRARSVMLVLIVEHGVAADRLEAEGYGEDAPLYADPYDGRNRRVEFHRR